MSIHAKHVAGNQFELQAGEHHLTSDNRVDLGGGGLGPMPSELMLWAVATCFGQAVLFVASRMRKPVAGLALEVSGVKDPHAQRFGQITIGVLADGPTETLQSIVATARKYCYITNSLSPEIQIEVDVRGAESLS